AIPLVHQIENLLFVTRLRAQACDGAVHWERSSLPELAGSASWARHTSSLLATCRRTALTDGTHLRARAQGSCRTHGTTRADRAGASAYRYEHVAQREREARKH